MERYLVHPRLRGELVTLEFKFVIERRFIPAYAGNSYVLRVVLIDYPVHPRLRGELNAQHIEREATSGSSPLTRGTQCYQG